MDTPPCRPLRVLLVAESCSTGVGRHVIDLASGLIDRGHSVHLLYSRSRIDERFEQGLTFIIQRGATGEEVEMHRQVSLKDVTAILNVRRVIKRRGPFDIIHGHSSKGGAIARIGGLASGAKRIYSPHAFLTMSPDLGARKRLAYKLLERVCDYFGHASINVSGYERSHALSMGLPPHKMRVVPNGVPAILSVDRLTLRRELGIAQDEFLFGFIGRLSDQKNPLMLVESFTRCIANNKAKIRLVIIGDGPLRQVSQNRADALGVGNSILWAGDANGPRLIGAFDALLLPSQYESFPYVLLEAGAHGIPMICTNTGAASEYVVNGLTGYVVPVGDVHGFADAMAIISSDPMLASTMGLAALARSSEFTLDAMIEGIEQIYFELLS